MVHLFALAVLISSLTAFASPVGKRTVAQVEADIATISDDVVRQASIPCMLPFFISPI